MSAKGTWDHHPREFHQCCPTKWQTWRLRIRGLIEFDEWTCAICGKTWVFRYRTSGSGMNDFRATWEPKGD